MRVILYIFFFLSLQAALAQDILSPKYIMLSMSNDVINKTDYYYTNGLGLTFNHPFLRKNPFNKLIPSLPKATDKIYGFSLIQDIYTPENVDTTDYLPDDRPYVGTLMLYMKRTSFQPARKLRLYSGLGFGFIGNIALGEQTQDWFHNFIGNNLYEGWYNQLDNKLLMNYSFELQKGLHVDKNNQFIATANAEFGNLRTNASIGYLWRVGKLNPYFESYVYKKGMAKFFFSFFLDVKFKMVLFDATIYQSHSNLNTPSYSLNNFVFHSRIGVSIMYSRFTVLAVQSFLSPEFSTGLTHKYASLELSYRF